MSRLVSLLRAHATDLLAAAGVVSLVWGVRGWSAPASWVVLGLVLLGAWYRLERAA